MLHKNQTLTITVYGKKVQVKQVNKTVAKRLYNAGHNIHLLACNLNPNSAWNNIYTANVNTANMQFDTMLNHFTYYNCGAQLGRYPHFYAATNLL